MKINVDNTNIEYVNLQGKLELSIEHLSRAFTIQVEFPEFISENGINYFIYKNSIYADLIYIVPPEKKIYSYINKLDKQNLNQKDFTICYELLEPHIEVEPSTLQKAVGLEKYISDSSQNHLYNPQFRLDEWYTASSKDIAEVLFKNAILNTIRDLKARNTIRDYSLVQFCNQIPNLFRWVGHVQDVNLTEIKKCNNSILFPEGLLTILTDPTKQILTDTIDFSGHSSNTKNNKYSLQEGVKHVTEREENKWSLKL